MSQRTIAIPVTTLVQTTNSTKSTESLDGTVSGGNGNPSVVILYSEATGNQISEPEAIDKVELVIWHNNADLATPIKSVEFVKFATDISGAATTLYTHVANQSTIYTTKELHGVGRVKETIVLGSSATDDVCTDFLAALLLSPKILSVAIRRKSSETEIGNVDIGGPDLVGGMGEPWEIADSVDYKNPPVFLLTVRYEAQEVEIHEMRYTTDDPTDMSGQQTPQNSIGGYVASNSVYTIGKTNEFSSASQTAIQLSSSSSLPTESSGLILLGPEVARFGSVNTSAKQLLNLTRGIVPGESYSSFPSFGYAQREPIRYLSIDRLFNTQATVGLEQYRCFAVIRTALTTIADISLYLLRDPNADVYIDIGIEVPEFDSRTNVTISQQMLAGRAFTSTSSSLISAPSGFFEGAHIVMDPDGSGSGPSHAIIESFDVVGGKAEFIVDRDLPFFQTGENFRIYPAPAQRVSNDSLRPVENSGLFFGFFDEEGTNIVTLSEHASMQQYDVFYVWVKRVLQDNRKSKNSTGAVIVMKFDNTTEETT